MSRLRVAADVGGTFTDVVVVLPSGATTAFKVPSTPGRFEEAVLAGIVSALDRLGVHAHEVTEVLHATTAGTNAVLERSGPPTALVTTRGFRDVLEIGRLRTPTIYDLGWRKPPPLVPRRARLEVDERTAADGTVVRPPDLDGLVGALDEAVAAGVTALAVSLLHSPANPAHEHAVAGFISDRHPHVSVTVGSDIVAEVGEFERTSTAVLNAYLRPVMAGYLDRLGRGLADAGVAAPVLVMQSSGGMMAVGGASRAPVHLLESGPAAGVLAAAHVARVAGAPRAISFDMGGTTAKASLIEDFEPLYAGEFSVGSELSASSRLLRGAGYPVRLPVVDLAEVGAGGGSIARVDAGGALVVGPASAGAEPGPACYSKGGTAPTVTDANLVLGYVSAAHLAAAGLDVDAGAAERAVRADVAAPLGLDVGEAAQAVHRVADHTMARALRAVSTERGRDITGYTLIAFGGGGGLHGATLAEAVGITRVVVPPLAGVLSAVGLLRARVSLSATETLHQPLDAAHAPAVDAAVARMVRAQTAALAEHRKEAGGGADPAEAEVKVEADLRYVGEGSELALPVGPAPFDPAAAEELAGRFRRAHLEAYGHGGRGTVEVVRLRVTALAPAPESLGDAAPAPAGGAGGGASRPARFGEHVLDTPILARADVGGEPRPGPLLVDEADTTTVVPPGWTVRRDASSNLIVERAG